MTANKNEPDKKAGSATPQTPARPHATLDLKAKDVTPAEAAKAASTPAKDAVAQKDAETAKGASADARTETTAAKAGAAPVSPGKGAGASAASGAGDKASQAGSPPPPPSGGSTGARSAPRGYGGFFTHVAAGIAGGIVALFAADMLASQLGFVSSTESPDRLGVFERRLTSLESTGASNPDAGQLAARLAAAEAKLGHIDQLDANIEGVSKRQGNFTRELSEISERLKGENANPDVQPRITKLEEQLQLMSEASAKDPQTGQLPQLAAITGKLADLESTVSNQLDALRRNLHEEIDTRLTAANEAGQAARSGTQRIDRELSTLKAETAEMATGVNNIKTDNDRINAALKTTQEDLTRLKSDIDTRLAGVAKPEHVSAAVAPVSEKLDKLQQDVQGVLQSEGARRSTAERIVLSLELANLKRAIDRGQPYAAELKQARDVAGNTVDLSPLDRYALEGVPTPVELRTQFRPVTHQIIDAQEGPADASLMDRLLTGAKSVVRVRRTDHSADDKSVEAIVGRMEVALNEDRLGDVLREAKDLPAPAQAAANDFLAKVEARASVDSALATVESQLKASLASAPDANPGSSAQ